MTPVKPSYVFGYWRPWKEDSKLFDSYFDYVKDVSLVKYGAETVGSYINQASKEQVQAINHLGQAMGRGMNVLSNQLSEINNSLFFLNKNLDIQIEQQKLSNLLLKNIAELLRVPDSEKERQHSIELGIKFFVNAQEDEDLYADALEQLMKAEMLMKQDYFVLHRIGCIYLYVEKFINPEKALDYFLRAAKYASVESDPKAMRLANVLTQDSKTVNSLKNQGDKNDILKIAADSYEKASFSAYVLGQFEDAVKYQAKALEFNPSFQNRFLLAKYQARNGVKDKAVLNLDKTINDAPEFFSAVFKEIDLINEPDVIGLLETKNNEIDKKIKQLPEKYKNVKSTKLENSLNNLDEWLKMSYKNKIAEYAKLELEVKSILGKTSELIKKINDLISEIKNSNRLDFSIDEITDIKNELNQAKDLPLEKMNEIFNRWNNVVENKWRLLKVTENINHKNKLESEKKQKENNRNELIRLKEKLTKRYDYSIIRFFMNIFLSIALFIFLWIKIDFKTSFIIIVLYNIGFAFWSKNKTNTLEKSIKELEEKLK